MIYDYKSQQDIQESIQENKCNVFECHFIRYKKNV
jgi:hypothetical protein